MKCWCWLRFKFCSDRSRYLVASIDWGCLFVFVAFASALALLITVLADQLVGFGYTVVGWEPRDNVGWFELESSFEFKFWLKCWSCVEMFRNSFRLSRFNSLSSFKFELFDGAILNLNWLSDNESEQITVGFDKMCSWSSTTARWIQSAVRIFEGMLPNRHCARRQQGRIHKLRSSVRKSPDKNPGSHRAPRSEKAQLCLKFLLSS